MGDNQFRSAPDFTTACIVMFGVNLAWILFAIWSIWGLLAALAFSYLVDKSLTYLRARAVARQRAAIQRGKRF